MRILPNSAKFSADRPLLTAYFFRAQWLLPLALITWGLWPPSNFWQLKICLELRQNCILSTIL